VLLQFVFGPLLQQSRESSFSTQLIFLKYFSCIELMNGRWYGGRQLQAEFYDGKTDYRYKETEEEMKQRIQVSISYVILLKCITCVFRNSRNGSV